MAARRTDQLRARDADRNDTCQILDSALAEGQLTMAEHRDRVAAATKAATLAELQRLVTDLQPASGAVTLRPLPKPATNAKRGLLVGAIACAVLALGVAVAVIGFSDGDTHSADPAAPTAEAAIETSAAPRTAADPGAVPDNVAPTVLSMPEQLHTLGGMTGLLEQMRQRFGDTMGIELAITPDEAMLFRVDPTDDRSKLLYRFDGGWGDPIRRPRDDKDTPADLGAFDVQAVAEVLRTAPERLGIAPADVSQVFVDVDHIAEPPGPGALELLVKVETASGRDGYLYLDSAGNTKRVELPS